MAHSGAQPVGGGGRLDGVPTFLSFICLRACELFLLFTKVSILPNILLTYPLRQGRGCTVIESSSPLSSEDIYSFLATCSHFVC